MDRKHIWLAIGGVATAAFLAAAPAPALAQQAEICNPVVDGNGEPVMSTSGGVVLHSGSAPCPPVAAAPAAPATEVAPAAGPEAPVEAIVLFDFDESAIEPQFTDELTRVAAELEDRPEEQVFVTGHTDAIGTEEYNQALGQRRAEAVAGFLSGRGVDRDRMLLRSAGESQPVATNETPEGRALNRRAVVSTAEPATS